MKKSVQMFLISIVDTIRTRIVDCAELRKSALNNLFSSIDCLSLSLSLCPYILPSGRRYNVTKNIYNYIHL